MKKGSVLFALILIASFGAQDAYAQAVYAKDSNMASPGIPRLKVKIIRSDTAGRCTYIMKVSARHAYRMDIAIKDSTPEYSRTDWSLKTMPPGVNTYSITNEHQAGTFLFSVSALNPGGQSKSKTIYACNCKVQKIVSDSWRKHKRVPLVALPGLKE